ncbi:DUF2917 domain-containing protein [Ramlibacter sp. Leaf400]|uniref:DUF2917 domain-containing protein n=1 Tax=Ramlibacter sp. Leaf400 TaxID=1736365 RepID=UPI000700A97D|nr:hypothetical protein ASG30_13135 [Ramlibacter sp. Leaf400]
MTAASHLVVGRLLTSIVSLWSHPPFVRVAEPARLRLASVQLEQYDFRSLPSFKGGTIRCLHGCVWLTHDGDCRDVVLEAGEFHVVDRDTRLVVHALAPSLLSLMWSK